MNQREQPLSETGGLLSRARKSISALIAEDGQINSEHCWFSEDDNKLVQETEFFFRGIGKMLIIKKV